MSGTLTAGGEPAARSARIAAPMSKRLEFEAARVAERARSLQIRNFRWSVDGDAILTMPGNSKESAWREV